MSKRLERMRRNPAADWTIGDIEAVCREFRIECVRSRKGSSHYKIKHPAVPEILTVPFARPIKSRYIRLLIAFIDAVRAPP
jgi:hypothetical protein